MFQVAAAADPRDSDDRAELGGGRVRGLEKLGAYGRPMQKQNSTMAHMWIADPTKPGIIDRMFSTHPPIADRAKRLRESGLRF